jgi:hypothetical protein
VYGRRVKGKEVHRFKDRWRGGETKGAIVEGGKSVIRLCFILTETERQEQTSEREEFHKCRICSTK